MPKPLGRLLADAECTAHEIMAALGHTTLAEAERYTREADRCRGGQRAVVKLDERRQNKIAPNRTETFGGKSQEYQGNQWQWSLSGAP